jgi:hypothetical protein
MQPGVFWTFGRSPNQIDIITRIEGADFATCYRDTVQTIIDGVPVSLISLADLRANKLATGRSQDLADLDHLPFAS